MAAKRDYEERMKKSVEVLQHEFSTIRAGRASAAVLDRVSVDYYGAPTQITAIASVSAPMPNMLAIQPWDKGALKLIEKAIQASDLGINPQNDGAVIRLTFPAPSEERRKELVKQVKKFAEDTKIAVRNIRRDAMEEFKAQKKKSEITEDDLKNEEKELQNVTDKYIKECDTLAAKKEKELLAVENA